MQWILLTLAIIGEVIGTSALKASDGLTHWGYALVTLLGYAVAFYFLSIVLKTMPVGVAYAIWSGAGVALVTLIGLVVFQQKLDFGAMLGIGLIVAGVLVLNVFSGTIGH